MDKLLRELGKSTYGQALKQFLEEELKTIGDVDSAHTEAELIGRQLAKKTIKKLFSFMEPQVEPKSGRSRYS